MPGILLLAMKMIATGLGMKDKLTVSIITIDFNNREGGFRMKQSI